MHSLNDIFKLCWMVAIQTLKQLPSCPSNVVSALIVTGVLQTLIAIAY